MSIKLFFFDTETTGINPRLNDIIHLSCIIDIDFKTVFTGDYYFRPFNIANIDKKALEINGFTKEEILKFPPASISLEHFENSISLYVDKYDSEDKMFPVAYNGFFDLNFLSHTYEKCENNYLGSFINWRLLDPLQYLRFKFFIDNIRPDSFKLSEICRLADIEIEAHNASSDTKALRELFYKLLDKTVDFKQRIQDDNEKEDMQFSRDFENFANKMSKLK